MKNPKTNGDPDEPAFRYSLEMVATIAAHFADGDTSDSVAAERAIKLLDAVSTTIERKTIMLRARTRAVRLSEETPRHLEFAKGIRRVTGKRTETEATKAFRDYVRLNLRLSELGHPTALSGEQVGKLLEPLAGEEAKEAEEARIAEILARYRRKGFDQVQLITIKEAWDRLQAGLVRPYRNSKKGKKGGRPRSEKQHFKKSLEQKPISKK